MLYQHTHVDGSSIDLPLGKVVCVGRNYLEHIQELRNEKPEKPVIFMKPSTSLCKLNNPIKLPDYTDNCQHEIELAVLIQSQCSNSSEAAAKKAIWGYGLALDLTLRDVQSELKKKGLPWEMAKAFDGACPTSTFIPAEKIQSPQNLNLGLSIDDNVRQKGNTQQMMFGINELISYISKYITLQPGDIVLTGTPAGVGPLHRGDRLQCYLGNLLNISTSVC